MSSAPSRADSTRWTLTEYRSLPFSWKAGVTCVHLAQTHLRNMGHEPPAVPAFRSPIGAKRALTKAGFGDLADLLDSLLPRVPPASAWVGDLGLLEGADGFDSIVINAGGKWLGYHDDDRSGLKPMIVQDLIGAWRA